MKATRDLSHGRSVYQNKESKQHLEVPEQPMRDNSRVGRNQAPQQMATMKPAAKATAEDGGIFGFIKDFILGDDKSSDLQFDQPTLKRGSLSQQTKASSS